MSNQESAHITLEEAQAELESIRKDAASPYRDPESLHGREDKLHLRILAAIAAGAAPDPAAIAAVGAATDGIDFARWCA